MYELARRELKIQTRQTERQKERKSQLLNQLKIEDHITFLGPASNRLIFIHVRIECTRPFYQTREVT